MTIVLLILTLLGDGIAIAAIVNKTNERNDAASVDQTATDDTAARRQWRQTLTVGFRADDGATPDRGVTLPPAHQGG